jgi:hypothetical protein
MPEQYNEFDCASGANDQLVSYTSVQGGENDSVFALVITSACNGIINKSSVQLDVEDCQRLRDQLTDHIAASLLTPAL